MNNWKNENTDNLCKAILSLENVEECYSFLEDICTINEIIEMSKRLEVAKLLDVGMSYSQIIAETGISAATISRISKCLGYGNGGYKTVIDRCKENKNDK